MPATLTDAGLEIQTQAQILAELQADLTDPVSGFGDHDVTSATSPVAIIAGIAARREALYQSLLSAVMTSLYPAGASGTTLDRQATIVGAAPRIEDSNSTILARLEGDPGVDVGNKLVRYVPNQTLWRTPGIAILDGLGQFAGLLRAEDAGPVDADVSTAWEIVSVTDGWDTVVTIETAQLGEFEEDNPTMRDRLARTDSVALATEPAIVARTLEIPGVTSVVEDNNRSLVANANGVPGKSVELLVVGGEDLSVAEMIHSTYCADTGTFGNTTVTFVNVYGKEQTVRFSRVDEVQVFARVTLTATGAETPLPDDYVATVRAAVQARAEQMVSGQDLHPAWFVGAIVDALPVNSVVTVALTFAASFPGPYAATLPMSSRQLAKLSAGETPAVAKSIQRPEGFDITAGWHLDLEINGDAVSVIFVGGVGISSQTIAAEVQAAIAFAGLPATASGQINRLQITTDTVGPGSTIEIMNTSTAGLLAELSGDFAVPALFQGYVTTVGVTVV